MKIAIICSHPIQYYSPLFREIGSSVEVEVMFAHRPTAKQQAVGFGDAFEWDVDLVGDLKHRFLQNVAKAPGTDRFGGCDVPGLRTVLRDSGCDAVLVLGWHLKVYWQAIWAARTLGLPVVVRGDSQLSTPRGLVKRAAKAVGYPAMLRAFSAIAYTGSRNREYLLHYRYPEHRLFRSPHCVDTRWFGSRAAGAAGMAVRSRFGIPHDARVLLFAGKLVPFKRPETVIETAARLRRDGVNVHVVVAGSGDLAGSLAEQATRCGAPVHFAGFCNQSEMPAMYAAADLLVLPSTGRETWGLVANEAIACGTPVLVSDQVGSAADLTGSTDAVQSFPFDDLDAMARKAGMMIAVSPDRLGLARLNDRFSLEAAASGIIQAAGFGFMPRSGPQEGLAQGAAKS